MLETAAALLDPAVRELLRAAAEAARAGGQEVWVVGGLVRDLLLGAGSRDVDLAVVGDGPAFAARLAGRLGAAVERHPPFETAHLVWREVEVDVVSTRRETYPEPAALPRVERGSLWEDLARRDFTVNALAVPVADFPGGELVDPMGGVDDLRRRVLRVHHPRSFVDDPTRVLRGVELEARLRFRLDEASERLAVACVAAGGLTALSGARLREAWRRTFGRGKALRRMVERLGALGALRALGLAAPEEGAGAIAERLETWLGTARGARVDLPPVGDLVLASLLFDADAAPRLAAAYGLTGGPADRVADWPRRARVAVAGLSNASSPAAAERAVEELSGGELLALAARLPEAQAAVAADVLLRQRPFRLLVTGDDLVERGIPEGPAVGRALEGTRRARLDGLLAPEDELAYALRLARGEATA